MSYSVILYRITSMYQQNKLTYNQNFQVTRYRFGV